MTTRKYIIKPRAQLKIRSFYKNVARKYRHTYDYDDFMRNVHDALDGNVITIVDACHAQNMHNK